MATPAIVRIQGIEYAQVYKHWDGYPEAMLPWLRTFNEAFANNRGDDPVYKFAQLLRSSQRDAEKHNLDESEFTGWGVVDYWDTCGAAFIYTLNADGTVDCIFN